MIFITKKQFEEEVQRRVWDEKREMEQFERIEKLRQQVNKNSDLIYELRMKVDPEFRKRNTPVCDPMANVVYTTNRPEDVEPT